MTGPRQDHDVGCENIMPQQSPLLPGEDGRHGQSRASASATDAGNEPNATEPCAISLFTSDAPVMTHESFPGTLAGAPIYQGSASSSSQAELATRVIKRNRHTVAHDGPTAMSFATQLPSAQKDADDPTTSPDSSQRATRGREHQTLHSLSRLFAGDATMQTSRTPSYTQAIGPLYMRATTGAIPLEDHLYTRGLLEGRHSDITVLAFGHRYNLHRLILDRAPFFTTALSEPWIESQTREVKLYPEEIDGSITQAAFELAIKRLYGVDISKMCDAEAIGLFATGCWLEMQDLIDASIESILRQMTPELLAPLIRLVTSNYYGRSGDRILESAKAMLSRNGWEMPLKSWDGMPGDVVRELVASDGFYVDSEWDRWVLAKRLLDRRLRHAAIEAGLFVRGQKPIPKAPMSLSLMAVRFDGVYRQNALTVQQPASDGHAAWLALYTNPDIERILVLLDEGIHYLHMDFEQLEFIRRARDVFGLPVMPDRVISNALWQQLALRQRVLNADESAQELGLSIRPPEPSAVNETARSGDTRDVKGKQKATDKVSEQDTDDIKSGSWDGNGKPRKFWIPSSDCNIVLGNGAEPVITTSTSFQRHATRLSATLQPEDAHWAMDFASSPGNMAHPSTRLDHGRPISAGGGNAGQPHPMAYTTFPPFRFSAEFPNPRFLKEKKRVYSRTVSYAGSLWNIYIQRVRSAKNVQLGVYLHRAKERDTEDSTNQSSLNQTSAISVDEGIGQLERELLHRNGRRDRRRGPFASIGDHTNEEDTSGSGGDPDNMLHTNGSRTASLFPAAPLVSRRNRNVPHLPSTSAALPFAFAPNATTPSTAGDHGDASTELPFFPLALNLASPYTSDESDHEDEPATAYPNPSLQAQREARSAVSTLPSYVDARSTIKTYFKIYSPSKGGRMLSIYESAPDRFNFSQSWGWKSSTLMLDEVVLGGNPDEVGISTEGLATKKGDGKLRFMVVIGNL